MRKIAISLTAVLISLTLARASRAEIDMGTCMAAWLLDEGAGDVAADWSGNGNDGDISNANWVDGVFGKALDFDGATSGVAIADSNVLNDVKDLTILAWVYLERASGSWNAIVGKNPYANGYLMWIQTSTNPSGLVYVGDRFDDRSDVQIELDRWYHLAFTRSQDGSMKFYRDGKLVKETESKAGPVSTKPGPLSIGGQSKEIIDGVIDEVALFNSVLDERQIGVVMTRGLEEANAVSVAGKLATTWAELKDE